MVRTNLDALQGISEGEEVLEGSSSNSRPEIVARSRNHRSERQPGLFVRMFVWLFAATWAVVLIVTLFGTFGANIPVFEPIARGFGWMIVTALKGSTARIGYAVVAVP